MRYVCDTLSVSSNAYCHSATRLVSFFACHYSLLDSLTIPNGSHQFHHKWSREGESTESKMLIPCSVFAPHFRGFTNPRLNGTMTTSFANFFPFSSVGQTIVNFIFHRFSLCFPPRKRNVFVFVRSPCRTSLTYLLNSNPPVFRISFPANVGAVFIGASSV